MRNGLNLPYLQRPAAWPNARDELRTMSTESLRQLQTATNKPPYLDAWLADELRHRHGGHEHEPTPRYQPKGRGPRWAKPNRP